MQLSRRPLGGEACGLATRGRRPLGGEACGLFCFKKTKSQANPAMPGRPAALFYINIKLGRRLNYYYIIIRPAALRLRAQYH